MTDLDSKLRDILNKHESYVLDRYEISNEPDPLTPAEAIAQIKQAFAEAEYATPENAKKVQEMVDQIANFTQDMAKLPIIVREVGAMTGQEWEERFEKELSKDVLEMTRFCSVPVDIIIKAAKRAAGIKE